MCDKTNTQIAHSVVASEKQDKYYSIAAANIQIGIS